MQGSQPSPAIITLIASAVVAIVGFVLKVLLGEELKALWERIKKWLGWKRQESETNGTRSVNASGAQVNAPILTGGVSADHDVQIGDRTTHVTARDIHIHAAAAAAAEASTPHQPPSDLSDSRGRDLTIINNYYPSASPRPFVSHPPNEKAHSAVPVTTPAIPSKRDLAAARRGGVIAVVTVCVVALLYAFPGREPGLMTGSICFFLLILGAVLLLAGWKG